MRSGDAGARNELIRIVRAASKEKVHLALQRRNARIARFEQTDDVLQEMLIRLDSRLDSDLVGIPAAASDFGRWLESSLALNLRRVLVDMARKHYGRNGRGHVEPGLANDDPLLKLTSGPARREKQRSRVHELIDRLPEEERVVIELRYYPDRSRSEVARLLKIDRETVKRRENRAEERLGRWLREDGADELGQSGEPHSRPG